MKKPGYIQTISMAATIAFTLAVYLVSAPPLRAREANGPLLTGQTVCICDDGLEWPPYTFYKRTASLEKTGMLTGFSIDVVRTIFQKHGISFSVELVPWKRCLNRVKTGAPFHMALNASFSSERAADYFMTRPYYQTTNYYFYSKKCHPDGLDIRSVHDLKRYQVCGLLGYNYETYGFGNGGMDQGAKTFPALIGKLHLCRCTLFMEKIEILAGLAAIGRPYLADPDLGRGRIPGMQPTQFHMLISRKIPFGKRLHRLIDEALLEMEKDGSLDRILKVYIP